MLADTNGTAIKTNLADVIGLGLIDLHQGIAVRAFHHYFSLLGVETGL